MAWTFRRSPRNKRTSQNNRPLNTKRLPHARLGLEMLEAREVPTISPLGVEFPVAQMPGGLYYPSVAVTDAGTSMVAWTRKNGDGSGNGVFARLFGPDGAAITDEFPVNTAVTDGHQLRPAVAELRWGGGFVAVWESAGTAYGTWDIRGQRFDFSGARVGDEFTVNTVGGGHTTPAVAATISGGFVVGWQSYGQDGSGWGVYGRRYDASGVELDAQAFPVNLTTTGDQAGVKVTANQAGILFAWTGAGGAGFGRAFQIDGTPRTRGEFPLSGYGWHPFAFSVAASSNRVNEFVVTFSQYGNTPDASAWGQYAQRFDYDGNQIGGTALVNTYTAGSQSNGAVAVAPDGGFVVAWTSENQDGSGSGIYAQRFDLYNNKVGGEFRVNTHTNGDQLAPAVAMDGSGNFTFVWESRGQDSGASSIYSQMYRKLDYATVVSVGVADSTAAKWRLEGASATSTAAFEVRRDGDLTKDLTVYYTVQTGAGNAVPGTDYLPLSGSVIIKAGQWSAGILVQPTGTATTNATKTVGITLSASPRIDYELDSLKSAASVFIQESSDQYPRPFEPQSGKPTVTFLWLDASAVELQDGFVSSGLFAVARVYEGSEGGPTTTNLDLITVDYTVSGSVSANDYSGPTGSVFLDQGMWAAPVVVTPVDDNDEEPAESLNVQFVASESYNTSVGGDIVQIQNDDKPPELKILSVEWVRTPGPEGTALFENRNAVGGLAIFPEKRLLHQQTADRVDIRVRLNRPTDEGLVYLRVYDVDDPSSSDPLLDLESQTTDNRGAGGTAMFGGFTNEQGVFRATYQTSHQPGDNYRAVATLIPNGWDVAKVYQGGTDAEVVLKATEQVVPSGNATTVKSSLLTVWRRLHVERDHMRAPLANDGPFLGKFQVNGPGEDDVHPGANGVPNPSIASLRSRAKISCPNQALVIGCG